MSKPKNRKKELKRQQKLDVKLMSSEEADLFERLQKPIIVERRISQNFDDVHVAMMQYYEREGEYPEIGMLNQLLASGTFQFKEADEIFRQAMHTPNTTKRKKLLRRVLELDSDYFQADLHLLIADTDSNSEKTLKEVLVFYDRAVTLWKQIGSPSWEIWEARPYLQGMMFCLEYFIAEGFLALARQLIELIDRKKPLYYPPNFIFSMLSFYNMVGDYRKVEDFYRRDLKTYQIKDGILLHVILSKILSGQLDEARVLFEELSRINPLMTDFFMNEEWMLDIGEIETAEVFVPFSMDSLRSALYPMEGFFLQNIMLESILHHMAIDLTGELPVFGHKGIFDLEEDLLAFGEWLTAIHSPIFKNIKIDIVRILSEHDLLELDDFKKVTEKEVLAIKGIGKVTIEKLKENGVVFKGE